jgi:hypothetical protein
VFRTILFTALLAPAVVALAWGDTLALGVGLAGEGVQARYYPAPQTAAGPHLVSVLDTRRVVPSADLPRSIDVKTANNNLDTVRHSDGRVYLAWRTAPDHFAGSQTVLHVVSSEDERNWREETQVALGTDLREPRLLSWQGSLFLYMSKLGKSRWTFEPQGVLMTEKRPDGAWTKPQSIGLPGYIAWRTRIEQGQPYMMAYLGGESIYRFDLKPLLHVDLLTTQNGRDWTPVDKKHRSVYVGGGSEADFTLDAAGELFGVIRNEAGDHTGFGSKLCTAQSGQPAKWSCSSDRRKFDSPYVFRVQDEVYLVARRNVTRDGLYDLDAPWRLLRPLRNQLAYVTMGKRCSIWHWDRKTRELAFTADLPSRGDTCFPSVMPTSRPDQFAIYNYSSPIDEADVPWSVGQRRPTYIYRHLVSFTPNNAAH